ncbi:MAG: hypothetical protein ACK5KL_21160 [Dysgonomonas sp.]
MKRLLILFAAIAGFSISSFAEKDYEVLWVLNNKSTFNTVTDYVQASPNQQALMKNIFYDSAEKLKDALIENDQQAAEKALYFNLVNVKSVLTVDQYKKYLTILNATIHNQQDKYLALSKNK